MNILIVIGIIFAYMIIGYINATIILTVDEECLDELLFNDEKLVIITIFWPFVVSFYGFVMLVKLTWGIIEFIGRRLAFIPLIIAVMIKATIEKKEKEVDTEESPLSKIKESRNQESKGFNRMGCSENWYDPYYAIGQSFDDETLDRMTQTEIGHLIKLAETIGEAFY